MGRMIGKTVAAFRMHELRARPGLAQPRHDFRKDRPVEGHLIHRAGMRADILIVPAPEAYGTRNFASNASRIFAAVSRVSG